MTGCREIFWTLATALVICSCVSQPPTSARVPPFEDVAFVTAKDLPELTQLESETKFIENHMYAGAAVGTVGGAMIGAGACGPVLYGPCVVIMSWYGLVAGTTGATVLGLHNYSGLSETDSAYVEEILLRFESKRNIHSKLSEEVEGQVPVYLLDIPENADIQIVVRVSRINFIEDDNELIRTELYGTIILAWAQESGEQAYREIFSATATPKDIDDLIADDGRLLESAIDQCLSQLANQMSSRLLELQQAGLEGTAM
jgi:hypothetical protein